jgi:hypothetical protein
MLPTWSWRFGPGFYNPGTFPDDQHGKFLNNAIILIQFPFTFAAINSGRKLCKIYSFFFFLGGGAGWLFFKHFGFIIRCTIRNATKIEIYTFVSN